MVLQQDGAQAELRAGSACLMTMLRPFVFQHDTDARLVLLTVSRLTVDHRLATEVPLLTPLALGSGFGRAVRDLATVPLVERGRLSRVEFDAVAEFGGWGLGFGVAGGCA